MEQQISNKVYESLQVPTEHVRTTTGKVLYANRYSGVAEVAMPEDLKALIDSDFGLIGKNILVQLEQKMKGYTNGPWYIDSRDGVIYIHNRKFHEEPVTTYTYQGENGEVLSVHFSTQKVTKRVKATLSPVVNPESKDLEVLSTGIDDEEKLPEIKANENNGVYYKNWHTSVGKYGAENNPADIPTIRQMQINHALKTDPNLIAAIEARRQLNDKWNSDVAEYSAANPAEAYRQGKEKFLNELSTDQVRSIINKTIQKEEFPSDRRAALNAALKNVTNGQNLKEDLYNILKDTRYLFEGKEQMEYMVIEDVDPRDYDPEHTPKGGATAWRLEDEESVYRGISALKKGPYTMVIDDTPVIKYKNPLNKSLGIYSVTVKVQHWKKADVEVPLYKLYSNLFSRYGGIDKWAWAANANANGGLKHTESKLICQMQVVGRPLLATSQVIILENVGKRWSGPWYIKQCTHSMDPGQGYITSLELVRNSSRAGSTTAKLGLSTQSVVANDAKANAKTSKGQDKKALSNSRELDLSWTYNEVAYFIESGIMDKEGNVLDHKRKDELLRKKTYYTEVLAKTPIEKAEGIAITSGSLTTSSGKVLPGKITIKDIQVPDDYWVKFDYMEVALRRFKEYIKNKEVK